VRESDHTVLAMLELAGDELVLDVNSAARLASARAWIERLPGVRLASVRTTDPLAAEIPTEDRVAGSSALPPPEAAAMMQEVLAQHYASWVDESIPALGHQTPRQAARTVSGKERVARLIRTMPAPPGVDVEPIRLRLYDELGIEQG
jgi:hypothetical protein